MNPFANPTPHLFGKIHLILSYLYLELLTRVIPSGLPTKLFFEFLISPSLLQVQPMLLFILS